MRKLAYYLKPFRKQCIIGPLCKLIEAILELLLPTIMAFVINEGVVHQDFDLVWKLGTVMIVMVFIGFLFSLTCQYNAALASQGFGTNLRNALIRHIHTFAYKDIDDFGSASLSNRLINDINQIQIAVAMLIRLVIRSPFIIIGAILMSMMLDLSLAFVLVASVPFIILILYIFIRFSSPMYHAYQKKLDRFAEILDDNFSGIRVIRAFVSQHAEKKLVYEQIDDLQKQMMKVSRYSALLNPLTALVVNGAIIILMWKGVLQIQIGNMQPGTIIAFMNYATSILIALIATSNLIVIFTKASASAQRINEVLQHVSSMQEGTKDIHEQATKAIRFHQVSFSYNDNELLFNQLSFAIAPHETIGIIGGTGSGKSTLVHLMSRFYDANEGKIELFGEDIKELQFSSLHKAIAIVSQKNELFSNTIYHNITMNKYYTKAEVQKALEDAQAMEFVQEMDQGMDTMLERGGSNLSGGQKQRLCIARALLQKSKILILDDACSALDFKTDAALRKAIQNYPITRILISQRVATLLRCDRIMVLHDGRIVNFASHQELFDTCEVYREICETQNIGRDAL